MIYPFQPPYHYPRLSPAIQAALRTAEGVIITTVFTLLGSSFLVLIHLIANAQPVDWHAVLLIFGTGVLLSLGNGLAAFLVAMGSPFGTILGKAIEETEPLLQAEIEQHHITLITTPPNNQM